MESSTKITTRLDEIAAALRLELPSDLKRLLLGAPDISGKTFHTADRDFEVHHLLSLDQGGISGFEGTVSEWMQNPDLPIGLVPFAIDPGGDYFCFDLRPATAGQIVFFQGEYFDDLNRAIVTLSQSAVEFMSKLR